VRENFNLSHVLRKTITKQTCSRGVKQAGKEVWVRERLERGWRRVGARVEKNRIKMD
jgi:hypothetical protein